MAERKGAILLLTPARWGGWEEGMVHGGAAVCGRRALVQRGDGGTLEPCQSPDFPRFLPVKVGHLKA